MLYKGRATAALTERPTCVLCDEPAVIDGATVMGPWGYLCVRHAASHGRGLGLGLGQVLLCGDSLDEVLKRTYRLFDEKVDKDAD